MTQSYKDDGTIEETTVSTTFTNGEATIKVYGGLQTRIEGLPVGTTYTIIETNNSLFDSTRTDGITNDVIVEAGNAVAFENEHKKGGLEVKKTVNSDEASDFKAYNFTVELYSKYDEATGTGTAADIGATATQGVTYEYGEGDARTSMTFYTKEVDGVFKTIAEFTLTNNQTVSAAGIPIGLKYVVTETDGLDGLVRTSTGEIGTITGNGNNKADFTNTRAESGLIVSKSVSSELTRDHDKEFDFTLTLWRVAEREEDTSKTGYDQKHDRMANETFTAAVIKRGKDITNETPVDLTTDENGQYTFKLKDGQILVIQHLPENAPYLVEEAAEDDFTTSMLGETGTIRVNGGSLAEFVNTRKPGILKITKIVDSPLDVDQARTFEFNVKLYEEDTEGNRSYLTATIAGRHFNGVEGATFFVKAGQTLELDGLPSGVHYEVTETLANDQDRRFYQSSDESKTFGTNGVISATNKEETIFSQAQITNVRKKGDLELSKTVVSADPEDQTTAFSYTIALNRDVNGTFEAVASGTGTVGGTDYMDAAAPATGKVVSFTHGRAQVTLTGGATLTIKGLPTQMTYTIFETPDNDFTADGLERTGTINDTSEEETEKSSESYTNTRRTGELEVTKKVDSPVAADYDVNYSFTVTFNKALTEFYVKKSSVTGDAVKTYPTSTTSTETEKSCTYDFTLKDGETITISGIPTGTGYEVTENTTGYTVTKTGEEGTISSTASKALFTNTRQNGGLIISKSVVSDVAADRTKEFDFTLKIDDRTITGDKEVTANRIVNGTITSVTETLTFKPDADETKDESTATFKLKDGESISVTGLPSDIHYEVTENLGDDEVVFVKTESGTTGDITNNVTAAANVTNTRKTGDLEISKEVVSDIKADETQVYTFEVELKAGDAPVSGTYSATAEKTVRNDDTETTVTTFNGAVTFTDGKATVTLTGGEKLRLTGLPVGTSWKVVEDTIDIFDTKANGADSNTAESTADTLISNTVVRKAEFTNTRKTGKLVITKTVDSQLAADRNAKYVFDIFLDADINKTYSGAEFTNGAATVELTAENGTVTKTIEGLPAGIDFTVTEHTVDGMTTTVYTGTTAPDSNTTYAAGSSAAGSIINNSNTGDTTYAAFKNTRDAGSITVDKSVFVDGEDRTDSYKNNRTFYVKVKGVIGGTTYWITSSNGTLTKDGETNNTDKKINIFEVKPGTTLTIGKDGDKALLPIGEYTVIEVADRNGTEISAENVPGSMGNMTFLADLSRTKDEVTVVKAGTGKASIVNAYTSGRYSVAVTKQWLVNGKVTVQDDTTKINVKLQRSTDGQNWAPVTGISMGKTVIGNTSDTDPNTRDTIELNKANNWSAVAIDLPEMDENGNRYEYRWVELDSDGNEMELHGISDGWAAGASETIQSSGKDEKTLFYLTKLNNSRVSVEIPVKKTVDGDYHGDEQFEAALTGFSGKVSGDDAYVPAKVAYKADGETVALEGAKIRLHKDDTGTFAIEGIDKAGIYTATIAETAGSTPGMTYDGNTKTVTFEVEWAKNNDDKDVYLSVSSLEWKDGNTGKGTLSEDNPVEVKNIYKTGSLEISKKVEETDAKDKEFFFNITLKDGENGITGLYPAVNGDNKFGVQFTDGTATVFLHKDETVTISGLPQGTVWTVAEDSTKMPAGYTLTSPAADADDQTGTIGDTAGEAEFENTYTATGTTTLNGTKTIENRTFRSGDKWTFTVTADPATAPMPNPATVTIEPTSGKTAAVEFGNISYTLDDAGKTYTYTIAESGDVTGVANDSAKTVTVTVEDNGDGTLKITNSNDSAPFSFVNTYSAAGEVELTAQKVLEGRDMTAEDSFTFELRKENGELVETKTVTGPGTDNELAVTFGKISYTLADLGTDEDGNPKETKVKYVIREVKGTDGSLTYATNEETVTVTLKVNADDPSVIDATPDKNGDKVKFTNKYETTESTVTKNWEDNENAAKKRPTSLNVNLLANNKPTGVIVTLPAGAVGENTPEAYKDIAVSIVDTGDPNKWSVKVKNLPMYIDGELQTYTWIETLAAGSEYTMTDVSINGNDTTITNAYDTERTALEVLKVWDDDNDSAGFRPPNIKVTLMKLVNGEPVEFGENELLYSNGKAIPTEYTLSKTNHWTALVSDLPKNDFTYVWVEDESGLTIKSDNTVLAEYEASKETTEDGSITYLINKYEPEKVSIEIAKTWDDKDDQDGVRPDHVDVKLMADGKFLQAIRLEKDEGYRFKLENLPKHAKGKLIVYSYEEYAVDGYELVQSETTSTLNSTESNAWTISLKNKHIPYTTKVEVKKTWDDANNQDGKRSGVEATVQLQKTVDGTTSAVGDPVTVGAADDWSKIWEDLPVNEGGKQITYSVVETLTTPNGYELTGYAPINVAAVKDDSGTIVVTNSHTPETTSKTILKVWDDAENKDHIRPDHVDVELKADGEVIQTIRLSKVNNWTATVSGLPVYKAGETGQTIKYTWYEYVPEGYVATFAPTKDAENNEVPNSTTVTNTHEPETTSAVVTKVWDDDKNHDGKRPESVTMKLMANNQENGVAVTLMEGSYTGVPKVTVDGEEKDAYTVTFSEDKLTATVSGLPVYDEHGDKYSYSWKEDTNGLPDGYSIKSIDITVTDGVNTTTITNIYKPEYKYLTVMKVWDDNNDQDNMRPESLTVELLAATPSADERGTSGTTVATVSLTAEKNWMATVENLPKFNSDGQEIVYSWKEEAVANYTARQAETVQVNGTEIVVLKNSHTPETVEVPVTKIWDDANNQDGVRPTSITVILYADGTAVTAKTISFTDTDVTVSADGNSWSYTFENLPKYRKGYKDSEGKPKAIEYTVDEFKAVDLTSYYEKKIEGGAADGYKITNTHTPYTTQVEVKKTWDDANDIDGRRSGVKATVQLQKTVDGTTSPVGDPVTVGAADDWSKVWENLPVNEGGKQITYSVVETVTDPNGYSAEPIYAPVNVAAVKDDSGTIVITNTHKPEETEAKVQKIWDDDNNAYGKRPDEIEVLLKADGKVIGSETLNDENSWTATVSGLPKYRRETSTDEEGTETAKSVEIEYTWAEASVPEGYAASESKLNADTGYIEITNTYLKSELVIEKVFSGLPEGDEAIDAQISKLEFTITGPEGFAETTVTYADFEDDGRYSLKDVPAGNYTVTETNAEGLVVNYRLAAESVTEGMTEVPAKGTGTVKLVNIYEDITTEATVQKIWMHNGNPEEKQPTKLTVRLTANAEGSEEPFWSREYELNAENGWSVTEKKLALTDNNGNALTYSWTEDEEDEALAGYTLTSTTVSGTVTTLVNTFGIETAMVVQKVWSDGNDNHKDDKVTVKLLKNGEEMGEDEEGNPLGTYELSAENNWTVTVEGLPLTENGEAITYSWSEVEVPGYVAAASVKGNVTTITNTKIPDALGAFTATKTWTGGGSGKATLILTGKVRDDEGVLHEVFSDKKTVTGDGEAAWENVPLFTEDGKPIFYSLTEQGVKKDGTIGDYISTITGDEEKGYTVVNHEKPEPEIRERVTERVITVQITPEPTEVPTPTPAPTPTPTPTAEPEPELTSASVVKVWNDDNNKAGLRPSSLRVTLSTGASYTLNAANNWSMTVSGLPKYDANGSEIRYTWTEQSVVGYTSSSTSTGNTTVFTNTYRQPVVPNTPGKGGGTPVYVFEDYDTPLGVEVIINHVGDCYE